MIFTKMNYKFFRDDINYSEKKVIFFSQIYWGKKGFRISIQKTNDKI